MWVVLAGLAAWASLTVATTALAELPFAALLPLLVLAATFEIAYAVHTGVERIGRYIQVFFEDEQAGRGWESQAMAYGRLFRGRGSDPLFALYFSSAAILNFVPVVIAGPVAIEWGFVGVIHLLFVFRVLVARREAGLQRALDLERFQQLKSRP